jgi:hypothetical protein
MRLMNRGAVALACASLLAFACSQSPSDDGADRDVEGNGGSSTDRNDTAPSPGGGNAPVTPPSKPASTERLLRLSFTDLPALENGFSYESWAIVDGRPISTGKLATGVPSTSTSMLASAVASSASAIVITIEPANDTDPRPSMTKVLAGPLLNGRAELDIAAKEAIGTDFAIASGTFILATPTDGPMTNERSGVWFLVPPATAADMPMPALELGPLPDGWSYEGWAVVGGEPLSTGKFRAARGADLGAPFSASVAPPPPFPGEDFVVNAPAGVTFPVDLRNAEIVITVEPNPDDSPMPYRLKPLAAMVPADAMDHTSLPLANESTKRPRGIAEIVEGGAR